MQNKKDLTIFSIQKANYILQYEEPNTCFVYHQNYIDPSSQFLDLNNLGSETTHIISRTTEECNKFAEHLRHY